MGGLKEKNNSTTIAEKELQRQKIFKWGIKRKYDYRTIANNKDRCTRSLNGRSIEYL